jgi:hypothetical protein
VISWTGCCRRWGCDVGVVAKKWISQLAHLRSSLCPPAAALGAPTSLATPWLCGVRHGPVSHSLRIPKLLHLAQLVQVQPSAAGWQGQWCMWAPIRLTAAPACVQRQAQPLHAAQSVASLPITLQHGTPAAHQTPLVDALMDRALRPDVPLHVPGHKAGAGVAQPAPCTCSKAGFLHALQKGRNVHEAFQRLLEAGMLRHDLTELPGAYCLICLLRLAGPRPACSMAEPSRPCLLTLLCRPGLPDIPPGPHLAGAAVGRKHLPCRPHLVPGVQQGWALSPYLCLWEPCIQYYYR